MTVRTEDAGRGGRPGGRASRARSVAGEQLSRADRVARGKDARAPAPLESHAEFGGSGKFDQAIADFAEKYADQNERDYTALQTAVKDGRVEATTGI